MQEFKARCGATDDAEAIFEVMVKAFQVEENSDKWHRWHNLAVKGAERFRVLEAEGKIIAVAHIARDRLGVGSCEIIKGDIGEVSVLPAFQGRGYGSALMRDVVQWLRDNDFDISRLGGYAIFYRRFGYVPFPRRFVEFPIEPAHAGANIISAAEMFRPPEDLPGRVRPYDASRDVFRKNELYHLFNRGRSGVIVRDFDPQAQPPKTWAPLDPLRIVYEVDGITQGYLFAHDDGRMIGDVAFNPSRPDAFVGLMKQILHIAAERGINAVTSRLPFDAAVLPILTKANIGFKLFELQGGYASNMIQIINLASLLQKITPELASRLQSAAVADWRGEINIGFEDQRVGLRVRDGNITVNVPASEDAGYLQTDQATLMKLIFGILSFAEAPIANRENIEPATAAVLSAWFPRQTTASGPWG